MFTYFYNNDYKNLQDTRKKTEKGLIKKGHDTPYPTYEQLKAEKDEITSELIFTIKNSQGDVVKKIFKKTYKRTTEVALEYAS